MPVHARAPSGAGEPAEDRQWQGPAPRLLAAVRWRRKLRCSRELGRRHDADWPTRTNELTSTPEETIPTMKPIHDSVMARARSQSGNEPTR